MEPVIRRFAGRNSEPQPTIYEHVLAHVPPAGPGLLVGGDDLPDQFRTDDEMQWMSGAFEGARIHHFGTQHDEDAVDEVLALLATAVSRNLAPKHFGRLYERIRESDFISLVDPLLVRIRNSAIPTSALQRVGHHLATEGRHREPVKFGIALLGLVDGDPDREVLLTLGRHDEFTLYCAVAIGNTDPDAEQILFQLAQSVDGWGRIHVVERLRDTTDPDIKAWILRGGYRNGVMNEYLAHIAATTGGLPEALNAQHVDDELLDAAGEIISALIAGGPAEDIDDYADAHIALPRFLDHIQSREPRLRDFVAAEDIAICSTPTGGPNATNAVGRRSYGTHCASAAATTRAATAGASSPRPDSTLTMHRRSGTRSGQPRHSAWTPGQRTGADCKPIPSAGTGGRSCS
jgi:hypothetical protein